MALENLKSDKLDLSQDFDISEKDILENHYVESKLSKEESREI